MYLLLSQGHTLRLYVEINYTKLVRILEERA
jgi:hypothetical protein